ncbi:MAG: hypothetical protein SGJ27_18175 [Candidatus Melainabacteria bacterium]|nr:hypothetical protein [Candidatus Melainabacteria bacterium]
MFSIDKKLSGITVVAVALGVCLSQPAQANDALGYIQDYFGGVNNNVNFGEAQKMAALDDDRAEVDGRIASAVTAGRIKPIEAGDLRAQLRNNRTLALQLVRDGRFSFADNARISNQLSTIAASLQNAIATNVMLPGRSNLALPPRGFVARTQVDELQSRISTRLNNGRRNGDLTRAEFESLRTELSAVDARKREMMNSHGMLSFQENQRLLSRLNRLQDQVRVDMNDTQVAGRNYPWY